MRTLPEHNDLIPLLRAISMTAGVKQPGRRYGPPPKPAPSHRQRPAPMTNARRAWVYDLGHMRMTARQQRQYLRMMRRSARRGPVNPS